MPGALSVPLVTCLSSNVTKVFNTHDKAECKSVQRVKDLGDGTFKSMTRLLGSPVASTEFAAGLSAILSG